jgi:polyprenyl P-hydroxybenzoate/phenylacrylic acid decarboxylase-like protein
VTTTLPLVVAITGASGAPYSVRLLQALAAADQPTWLIVSEHGFRLLETESGIASIESLRDHVGAAVWDANVRVFDDRDRGALPASGSVRTKGMVICPCSMGTVAAIATGTSRSLIERAADVVLKERRRLVVVPRETPYSDIIRTCSACEGRSHRASCLSGLLSSPDENRGTGGLRGWPDSGPRRRGAFAAQVVRRQRSDLIRS